MPSVSKPPVYAILAIFTALAVLFSGCEDQPATAQEIFFVKTSIIPGRGSVTMAYADGNGETDLVKGEHVSEPDGIDIDRQNHKMYWTNMGAGGSMDYSMGSLDGTIMRADLDGGNVEVLVPPGYTTTPKQIALDQTHGKMYWCDRGDVRGDDVDPKVMRANLDGSEIETLIDTGVTSPVGIALDVADNTLYFSDRYADKIMRADLDGTNVQDVITGTAYPVDLALDLPNRRIYWTSREDDKIYRANMDHGGEVETIVDPVKSPIGISLDLENGKIYYSSASVISGGIFEADLDGNNPRKIISGGIPLGLCYMATHDLL